MDTFIVGRHPKKNHTMRVENQCFFTKAWSSDCATSRSLRFLCLVLLDLYAHQIRQPSRPRTMLFSVLQQARTTLFQLTLLGVGSVSGLGPDLVGIHSISLAARYRVAACWTTLTQGLGKIQTARGHNCDSFFRSLSRMGERIACSLHGL